VDLSVGVEQLIILSSIETILGCSFVLGTSGCMGLALTFSLDLIFNHFDSKLLKGR